jgi:hypothetical protein
MASTSVASDAGEATVIYDADDTSSTSASAGAAGRSAMPNAATVSDIKNGRLVVLRAHEQVFNRGVREYQPGGA